jgi:pimeloyl-ACP methyl ester carboxylesterase
MFALVIALVLIFAVSMPSYACDFDILHMEVNGSGPVTVVFDSGYGDGIYFYTAPPEYQVNKEWSSVTSAITGVKTVEYDRIGLGQSTETNPISGKTAFARAIQLKVQLLLEGVSGPIVYVAHSWGGTTAKAYNALFPNDCIGFVFVDCTAPGELAYQTDWIQTNMPDFYDAYIASFTSADGTYSQLEATESQTQYLTLGNKPLIEIYCNNSMVAQGMPAEMDQHHVIAQEAQAEYLTPNHTVIASDCGMHAIMFTEDTSLISDAINTLIPD